MDEQFSSDEELSRLIADEYAGKILSATFKNAMSVQQISRCCQIPIAVAYRRVAKMEDLNLLKCVGYEEVYRGKKVSYYQCAVNMWPGSPSLMVSSSLRSIACQKGS